MTLAIVSSSIFLLRRKARRSGETYAGYKVPLYPLLPLLFVAFMLVISVNVLLTQTREALYGAGFFVLGLPIFLLMRRVSRRRTPAAADEPER
jgi:basic amino acid/polyamine antiporter, APA family